MRVILTAASLVAATCLSAIAELPSVEVTSCGQIVPPHTIGYLSGDLDCTGFEDTLGAVILGSKSTLELQGFTLSGGPFSVVCGEVDPVHGFIERHPSCRISGSGGIIQGADYHGVIATRLRLSQVTIRDCGQQGVEAISVRGSNVTLTGNDTEGIFVRKATRLVDSEISASGSSGIRANKIRLTRSSVIDNAGGPECRPSPMEACADLISVHRPRLADSTCGTSLNETSLTDWDLCQND